MWAPTDDWVATLQQGQWCADPGIATPVTELWNGHTPHACHCCKRGGFTGTALLRCSGCKLVKYCSKQHQRAHFKMHKKVCGCFKELHTALAAADQPLPSCQDSWSASRKVGYRVVREIATQKGSDALAALHTTESQYFALQPHCQVCFDTSSKLTECPRCHCVAFCSEHVEGQTCHDRAACDSYILWLCCYGMISEQGNPLILPSSTALTKWENAPGDWWEYFAAKCDDFEPMITQLLHMGPVIAMLTDGLTLAMTIVWALERYVQEASNAESIEVHLLGADAAELCCSDKYLEILNWLPACRQLSIVMVGPTLREMAPHSHSTADGRNVSISAQTGRYHQVADLLSSPDITIASHSGVHDPSYTEDWLPTLDFLKGRTHPCLFTGYNQQEIDDDTAILQEHGLQVLHAPCLNPFRGLRPFAEPSADNQFIYGNQCIVVVSGTS